MQITDLENMALANNPVIARAAAQIQAARGNWVQTGLPPNPRLGYVAEEVGAAGTSGRQGGFVGQQFMTAHKLSLNRQVASWQIEQAQQDLEAERLRVLTDVRTAFYDVLIAQERQELAANLVGISEQADESTARQYALQERLNALGWSDDQCHDRTRVPMITQCRNKNTSRPVTCDATYIVTCTCHRDTQRRTSFGASIVRKGPPPDLARGAPPSRCR